MSSKRRIRERNEPANPPLEPKGRPWRGAFGLFVVGIIVGSGVYLIRQESPRASQAGALAARPDARISNVLIFLVDTLRADHLGCYGYFRNTSPNIDAFAKQAVLFERGFSVSPWTRSSVVSLFTSMYPVAHACQDKDDSVSDPLVTMAELFQAGGYRTAGFSSNISISAKFNAAQGFDEFTYFERAPFFAAQRDRVDPGYVPIEGMTPDAMAWLDKVGDQRFFMYFHCTDPHSQYQPPQPFAQWGSLTPYDRYDGEIRYVDHYFRQIIDKLTALGKLDETLIVFTADHGEEWFDHGGVGHGHTLYNELLEVPLLIRHPRFAAARRTEIVRLVDLLPTLLELCELDSSGAILQGRSLAAMLAGRPDPEPEQQFVLGEVMYPSKIEAVSLEVGGWKAISTIKARPGGFFPKGKDKLWELFNTDQAAGEIVNLGIYERQRSQAARDSMIALRKRFRESGVSGRKSPLDVETIKALRSLGYIE